MTYRKKPEFLQRANLTKHFSTCAQARLNAPWRLLKPRMKIFTSWNS
ncbi:Unknown protein sequence [Pseudomonas savastanoi pv. phaseolicola]|nr:Unknown protein sequence [Pseudomonas savastanoi pv. phaseolicola]